MPTRLLAATTLLLLASAAAPTARAADISCVLHYTMSGGGAFYKHSTGTGEVSCSNGQRLAVSIESKGGGLTFGHSTITDGVGKFSGVSDIHEVIGGYATAEANAGGNVTKELLDRRDRAGRSQAVSRVVVAQHAEVLLQHRHLGIPQRERRAERVREHEDRRIGRPVDARERHSPDAGVVKNTVSPSPCSLTSKR